MCPECVKKAEKGSWQSPAALQFTARSSEGTGTETAWMFRTQHRDKPSHFCKEAVKLWIDLANPASSSSSWKERDLGSSFAPLSQAKFNVGILEPKCKFLWHPLGITAFCSALNITTNTSGVPWAVLHTLLIPNLLLHVLNSSGTSPESTFSKILPLK